MSTYSRWEDPGAEGRPALSSDSPVIVSRDPLLQALGSMGEVVCTLDFETYFSKDYNLDKCTTEGYVRDSRFEVLGVGVKWGSAPTVWLEEWEFRAWAKRVDWSRVIVCAHHCLPGDTEVLTRRGWVPIRDADENREIMQWDPDTTKLSWTLPLHKTRTQTDRFVEWNTNHHRAAYTPSHRMFINTPGGSKASTWRAETAMSVASRQPNNTYIPTGGMFEPENPIEMT